MPQLTYADATTTVKTEGIMGGPNPCGAYYPTFGPLNVENAVEAECWSKNPNRNYGSNTPQQGSGFCCDLFNRVNPDTTDFGWTLGVNYRRFDTIGGAGDSCPGCGQHYYNNNPSPGFEGTTSGSSMPDVSWKDEKPCEVRRCGVGAMWRPTKYVEKWSACNGKHIDVGCTMNHSFGLIMGGSNPTVNISHPGSPNGSCSSNCMQLGIGYWENVVAGEYLSYANPQPGHFSDMSIYDSESSTLDANSKSGPTGSKLIWAGFCPTQMVEDSSDLINQVNYGSCVNNENGSWKHYLHSRGWWCVRTRVK